MDHAHHKYPIISEVENVCKKLYEEVKRTSIATPLIFKEEMKDEADQKKSSPLSLDRDPIKGNIETLI